ncbi:phage tail protein [Billgrantia antri]|uniref:Phage tail protein n=1 Tax=Halomonas sulfidivorans TaxID=2733488 RepID=A0ABX7WLX0_9GAMM|nr:phage tail protein [Halomonas sulfidivorans]QTP60931.1 phage tail protein [Halomonas sulfidivorans]
MPQFYTLLTDVGQAKLANAVALGQTIQITELAVGDGGGSLPTPDSSATALVNEVRRAAINTSHTDPDNPSWIVVEQVLPPDVGGWTIREIGIYDVDGDLIGIGNYPETYKPVLSEGSSRTQTVRFVLEVSDTAAVTLKVDPSVVLATRKYVDTQRAEHEQDTEAHADNQIVISEVIPQAPNATNVAAALAALAAFAGDGYQNMAVFNAAGITDWPVPQELKDGHRKAHVTVTGAGGRSGVTNTSPGRGGGGGGGGTAIGLVDLSGMATVAVTVGSGGATDKSSSFGTFMSATGGEGGGDYTGGTAPGGFGGQGTGGSINLSGTDGSDGPYSNGNPTGGSGDGGSAMFGGATRSVSYGNTGITPTTPGAGAGGAGTSSPRADGAPGIVIVRW